MTPQTIIICVDDADYTREQLAHQLTAEEPTRWVVVACAPRMSRRIGKWLSHSARENWRDKWTDKLFARLLPMLERSSAHRIQETMVAKGPLPELLDELKRDYRDAQVLDVRRPKFDVQEPQKPAAVPSHQGRGLVPTALGSLGAVMLLAGE
jgi:hypothetical protein